MSRSLLWCVSVVALVAAAAAVRAGEPIGVDGPVLRIAKITKDDCATRIRKLEASDAEGDERLAEKRETIETCFAQYKNEKAIDRLVKECSKYEEQPIIKQHMVADCQLAAYRYANELRALKAQYRK